MLYQNWDEYDEEINMFYNKNNIIEERYNVLKTRLNEGLSFKSVAMLK